MRSHQHIGDSKHLGRMSKTKRVKGGSFKTGENYLLMLELYL